MFNNFKKLILTILISLLSFVSISSVMYNGVNTIQLLASDEETLEKPPSFTDGNAVATEDLPQNIEALDQVPYMMFFLYDMYDSVIVDDKVVFTIKNNNYVSRSSSESNDKTSLVWNGTLFGVAQSTEALDKLKNERADNVAKKDALIKELEDRKIERSKVFQKLIDDGIIEKNKGYDTVEIYVKAIQNFIDNSKKVPGGTSGPSTPPTEEAIKALVIKTFKQEGYDFYITYGKAFQEKTDEIIVLENKISTLNTAIRTEEEAQLSKAKENSFCSYVEQRWDNPDYAVLKQKRINDKFDKNLCYITADRMLNHYNVGNFGLNSILLSFDPQQAMVERTYLFTTVSVMDLMFMRAAFPIDMGLWGVNDLANTLWLGSTLVSGILNFIAFIPAVVAYFGMFIVNLIETQIFAYILSYFYSSFVALVFSGDKNLTTFSFFILIAFLFLAVMFILGSYIKNSLRGMKTNFLSVVSPLLIYMLHIFLGLTLLINLTPNLPAASSWIQTTYNSATDFVIEKFTGVENAATVKKKILFDVAILSPALKTNFNSSTIETIPKFNVRTCYISQNSKDNIIQFGSELEPNGEFRFYNVLSSIGEEGNLDTKKYEVKNKDTNKVTCNPNQFGNFMLIFTRFLTYSMYSLLSLPSVILLVLILFFDLLMQLIVSSRVLYFLFDLLYYVILIPIKLFTNTTDVWVKAFTFTNFKSDWKKGQDSRNSSGSGKISSRAAEVFGDTKPWGNLVKKTKINASWIVMAWLITVITTLIYMVLSSVILFFFAADTMYAVGISFFSIILIVICWKNRDAIWKVFKQIMKKAKDAIKKTFIEGMLPGGTSGAFQTFKDNGITPKNMGENIRELYDAASNGIIPGAIKAENVDLSTDGVKNLAEDTLDKLTGNTPNRKIQRELLKKQKTADFIDKDFYSELSQISKTSLDGVKSILDNPDNYDANGQLTKQSLKEISELKKNAEYQLDKLDAKTDKASKFIDNSSLETMKRATQSIRKELSDENIIGNEVGDSASLLSNFRSDIKRSSILDGSVDIGLEKQKNKNPNSWDNYKSDILEMDSNGKLNFDLAAVDEDTLKNKYSTDFNKNKNIITDPDKHKKSIDVFENIVDNLSNVNENALPKIMKEDFDVNKAKIAEFDKIAAVEKMIDENANHLTSVQANKLKVAANASKQALNQFYNKDSIEAKRNQENDLQQKMSKIEEMKNPKNVDASIDMYSRKQNLLQKQLADKGLSEDKKDLLKNDLNDIEGYLSVLTNHKEANLNKEKELDNITKEEMSISKLEPQKIENVQKLRKELNDIPLSSSEKEAFQKMNVLSNQLNNKELSKAEELELKEELNKVNKTLDNLAPEIREQVLEKSKGIKEATSELQQIKTQKENLMKQKAALAAKKSFDVKNELMKKEVAKIKGEDFTPIANNEKMEIFRNINSKLSKSNLNPEDKNKMFDNIRKNIDEYLPNTSSFKDEDSTLNKMEQKLRKAEAFDLIDQIQLGTLNEKTAKSVFSINDNSLSLEEKALKIKKEQQKREQQAKKLMKSYNEIAGFKNINYDDDESVTDDSDD